MCKLKQKQESLFTEENQSLIQKLASRIFLQQSC
jgi:hypothetical protein